MTMAQGLRHPPAHARQASRIALGGSNYGDKVQRSGKDRDTKTEATVAFIKRTLCSRSKPAAPSTDSPVEDTDSSSLEDLLPPLTSFNEIDIQLYAIIAAISSQFVHPWYNKITPDQHFRDEILRVIAHVTRELEQRLRSASMELLLLDELPAVINAHVDGTIIACRLLHLSFVS